MVDVYEIDLPGVAGWPRPAMQPIPPGRFIMGSPDDEERLPSYAGEEQPRRLVLIDYPFALGRCAVTVDAFAAFIAETSHDMGERAFVGSDGKWTPEPGRGWRDPGFAQAGDHPVTCVSWDDAKAFIAWLNARLALTGRPDAYRLPSEAEWEYACRAGTRTPFNTGATLTETQANFASTGTTPAGRFAPNGFGLCDMHGDTWDWCEDVWNANYDGAPDGGAAWTTGDLGFRVLRGGSWHGSAAYARSAMRGGQFPTGRFAFAGLRLARTLEA